MKTLDDDITFTTNNDSIELMVNADGIPVQKSSGKEFWPVLCMFGKSRPFVVAIFYGQGKPKSVTEYLLDLLDEYRKLKTQGIISCGKRFEVSVRAFVCDAPARAFLKCIKGHTAFKACERCDITGTKKEGRTVLHSYSPCTLRTNELLTNLNTEITSIHCHHLPRMKLIVSKHFLLTTCIWFVLVWCGAFSTS